MKHILREIGMIARCLESIANIEFKDLNLNKGQFLYLVRICENPGIIQEKVAEMIKVDRTTAARAIKKLEQQGFIVKVSDEENKKIKKLYATEKGMQLNPFFERELEHSSNVILKDFTDEDKEKIYQYLVKMRKNIEADWEYVKRGNKRDY
ncbi:MULTISPECIES: MarR family winged helix-turn-helix transcriptional regulator [Bacillaceae]|uniref:MarR family winged helix-turn-helix transcriptional regulator n=1 Tax=Metabacillus sp. 22489 TaxID=3453928 RepID=UPI000BA55FE6|nr:MarR family transcriptional regulator [Bacillus sp. 7586-K]